MQAALLYASEIRARMQIVDAPILTWQQHSVLPITLEDYADGKSLKCVDFQK